MNDHPNAARVRAAFEAVQRGETEVVAELIDEHCHCHVGGRSHLAGDYVGRDAVLALFSRLRELTDDTYTAVPHDVLANDQHTVALVNVEAERGGDQIAYDVIQVAHLEQGRVVEFWVIPADPYRSDPFWE